MNKVRVLQVVAMLWMAAWLTSAPAAVFWTGNAGNDWFEADNWNPAVVPGEAAVVSVPVGATILITNETAELSSFTMAGGTVTFSNWTTRLRADTVAINGGTLTLPAAFTNGGMSNRVWIVCSNMTLASAAKINVNGLGYARGNGPGFGGGNAGGGHGGFGSCGATGTGTAWDRRGFPYGNAAAPLAPGSGGGTGSSGGHGGGAVRIQASGAVTIYGEITANGNNGRGNHYGGAGGSGGSIFIECASVQGDGTGLLSAKGGNKHCACHGNGGSGGGGRIAIVYQPAAQTLVTGPNPPVKMSAARGTTGANLHMATRGTVYLPDGQFISTDMSATHWQHVTLVIPDFTHWHVASLNIGGSFGIRDLETLEVDGALTLAAGGELTLYGESTSSAFPGVGTALTVGGTLTIENGSSLVLESHWTNGISPYVECGSMDLKTGGTITANWLGWGTARGTGAGIGRGGGGYGGPGSPGRTGTGGSRYGVRHAPIFTGSGGGDGSSGGRGGGLVRVSARRLFRVDGTVSANGMYAPGLYGGGASGGGILLVAGSFQGAGILDAKGASGNHSTTGAGGGGRIAVWTPFLPYGFVQAIADREHPPATATVFDPEEWPGWTGTYSVAKGTGGENNDQAQDGTVFFGQLPVGTLIKIR